MVIINVPYPEILNFYTKVEWANDFLLQKRLIYNNRIIAGAGMNNYIFSSYNFVREVTEWQKAFLNFQLLFERSGM
jgi:hypothetical protein